MTGEQRQALAGLTAVVWDPAGTRVAAIVREGVAVIAVDSPEVLLVTGPRCEARSLVWSPDGASVVIAYDDLDLLRRVRPDGAELWRAAIGERSIDELVWSPDGRSIACSGDALVVCDADTGAVGWSRGGLRRRMAAGMELRVEEDGTSRVVERVRFSDERACLEQVRWSPDATRVAARWDGTFQVLDAHDGAVRAEGPVAAGGVLRWGPWGEPLWAEGALRLALCRAQIEDRRARSFTFSDDGRIVAAEGDRHHLWVQDERGARALVGHPRTITALAWSARGELATACRDGEVRRVSEGRLEPWSRLDAAVGGLVWSPGGAHLAVRCRDELVILRR